MPSGILLLLMMKKHCLVVFPTAKLLLQVPCPPLTYPSLFILLFFILYPVSQPDRAREPISELGAGLPLGSLTAALRPEACRVPRPCCISHQARFWSCRYARYCIISIRYVQFAGGKPARGEDFLQTQSDSWPAGSRKRL